MPVAARLLVTAAAAIVGACSTGARATHGSGSQGGRGTGVGGATSEERTAGTATVPASGGTTGGKQSTDGGSATTGAQHGGGAPTAGVPPSSAGSEDAGTASATPIDAFCDALADKLCALLAPCCLAESLDVQTCKRDRAGSCLAGYGPYPFDPTLAAACLAAYDTFADCLYQPTELAACDELGSERSDIGAGCTGASDCLRSAEHGSACVASVCTEVPYASEGADCSDASTVQCPPDLACVGGGVVERTQDGGVQVTPPTCQRPLPLGAMCTQGECSSGYCDTTTMTCAELPVEGSAYCVMR